MDSSLDSWDIRSYDEVTQSAFKRLTGSPLSLKRLHGGPYHTELDKRINIRLHAILTEYPTLFPAVVDRLIEHLEPVQFEGRGKLQKVITPQARCAVFLERELKWCEEEIRRHNGEKGSSSQIVVDEDDPWVDIGDDYESLPLITAQAKEEASLNQADGPISRHAGKRPSSEMPETEDARSPINKSPRQHLRQTSFSTKLSTAWTEWSKPRSEEITQSSPITSSRASSDHSSETSAEAWSTASEGRTQSPEEPDHALDTSKWSPYPALPQDKRAIYIRPPNPYQPILDSDKVNYAVQWEFERQLIANPTLSMHDVLLEDIRNLSGLAQDILPKLPQLIQSIVSRKNELLVNGTRESQIQSSETTITRRQRMYLEIDSEEQSIINNDLRGLGNSSIDWPYGGKIAFAVNVTVAPSGSEGNLQYVSHQRTRVSPRIRRGPIRDPSNPMGPKVNHTKNQVSFDFTLRTLDMPGKSFRLARRFGSRRIINLKYKDLKYGDRLALFDLLAGRCFVLFGRVFRALWAVPDGDAVYMVEVSDVVPEMRVRKRLEPIMPNFLTLLRMSNDLEQKQSQALAKWAARPQILFSDSVPGCRISPDSIMVVRDVVSSAIDHYADAKTEQILTDGCGLMSPRVARELATNPHLTKDGIRPCGVQMRIGGAKGLLALMSEEQEKLYPGKDIVLRDSMIKSIPSPEFANDPSLTTLDVVRSGYFKIGTTMSSEAIIAMAHCGVPNHIFVDMYRQGFNDLKDEFLPEPTGGEGQDDVFCRLVAACYKTGGARLSRQKRIIAESGNSARASGVTLGRGNEEKEVLEGEIAGLNVWERFDRDPINGQSGSIAESLMEALQAGFHPRESIYTGIKLHHLMKTLSTALSRNLSIPVERSISAFIVPDDFGILAPDEIHVAFSTSCPIDPDTKIPLPYLEGPVLAYRSPCKLPTDVRKFNAVYKPQLSHLRDCIVMSASTACSRSPASILGGGDYDGDTVNIIWDQRLVEHFMNADLSYADAPEGFEVENFDKEVVKGVDFLKALEGEDDEMKILNLQKFLLGAVVDDKSTGLYSDMHSTALYTLGFAHPTTTRLARMFCLVLDARKSGLRVKSDVKRSDAKSCYAVPEWRTHQKDKRDEQDNIVEAKRPPKLGRFVMDELMAAGKVGVDALMCHFPSGNVLKPSLADYDALAASYKIVKAMTSSTANTDAIMQCGLLGKHVQACYKTWQLIRQRNLPIETVRLEYESHMKGDTEAPHRNLLSPRKQFSRTNSRKEVADLQCDLVMLAQIRHLATIWRDEITIQDVPLITLGQEDVLKKLKISYGAECERSKSRQEFAFDMDFITTREIKAKSCGATVTTLMAVDRCAKPTYKREYST